MTFLTVWDLRFSNVELCLHKERLKERGFEHRLWIRKAVFFLVDTLR